MKKFVLASLFVVAAAAMQPALAAKGGEAKLCGKGTKTCACGKLPALCSNVAKPSRRPNAIVRAGSRIASITDRGGSAATTTRKSGSGFPNSAPSGLSRGMTGTNNLRAPINPSSDA